MANPKIPLVNLKRQYNEIQAEVLSAIQAVLEDCAFVKGPYVTAFEQRYAELYQGRHAIACANGTAAISLALEALGVGAGDEVLVPSHTFIATAEAVMHVGAIPVFVDSNPDSYCMDVEQLAEKCSEKTKAIVPVHIYGTPCDMTAIMRFAKERSLRVVEDCAQAHLATLHGKPLACYGDAATFSFYPGKNLGAYGDAGAVIVEHEDIAERIRKLLDHGRLSKYEHDIVGYNQRMDGLQGAVLTVKLQYLQKWTTRRQVVAQQYDALFDRLGIKRIQPIAGAESVYHLYVVEVPDREGIQTALNAKGIATGVHYPLPLHQQPAFQSLAAVDTSTPLPKVESFVSKILSIPICGSIQDEEVEYVCKSFEEAL